MPLRSSGRLSSGVNATFLYSMRPTGEIMKQKPIGLKIGIAFALVHLCLVILAFFSVITSRSSTASLVYIWFGFVDAPVLFLPQSIFHSFGSFGPVIQFGVLGSTLWLLIPWLIVSTYSRIFPKGPRYVSAIILIVIIPFILSGFFRLSFIAVTRSIQQQRPEELKEQLNTASSDFLAGKVIFEDYAPGGVSSITRRNCRTGAGVEILLALPRSIVFLSENYQAQDKLNLSDRKGFKNIEPLDLDGSHACGFLGYMYPDGVTLFDVDGKEIWKSLSKGAGTETIDGVRFGDMDGDGKPEFAILHRYREGITLIDAEGKTRWSYPINALGHMEMGDVQGDGKAAIMFDSSANANGITEFTILDSMGTLVKKMEIRTQSSEFALVKWPKKEAKPSILLTEEGKIRILNMNGESLMQLDAPGCRTFGDVNAVTVKFSKDVPEYLAIKKSLHPDISVLYVYDADGKLVFQKTQVVESRISSALAVIPADNTGVERLLVGESVPKFRAQVVEYSLAQAIVATNLSTSTTLKDTEKPGNDGSWNVMKSAISNPRNNALPMNTSQQSSAVNSIQTATNTQSRKPNADRGFLPGKLGHVRSGMSTDNKVSALKPPIDIRVDKVTVVQETDNSLVVDVFYTYHAKITPKEVKIFVLPNMPYWMTKPITAQEGSNVGRVSIHLYEKKMKEEQVYQYNTSTLNISFDHYSPKKFNGSIFSEVVPFVKKWKIKN
jgi:hypothetical protein